MTEKKAAAQHWYCCKWGWTLKLRLFASLYFGSGRRISIWLFVVNFNFIFSIGQRFRAGRYKISHLQQYLFVIGYGGATAHSPTEKKKDNANRNKND